MALSSLTQIANQAANVTNSAADTKSAAKSIALLGANPSYFKNVNDQGVPILNQVELDKVLSKYKTDSLDANQYRDNYNKFGWNVKSDSSFVKRGPAVVGISMGNIQNGMQSAPGIVKAGTKNAATDADFKKAASQIGLDYNSYIRPKEFVPSMNGMGGTETANAKNSKQYTDPVTGKSYLARIDNKGNFQTALDQKSLFNDINNQTKDLYLVGNALDRTGTKANKSAPHAAILFKADGTGNLVPQTKADGTINYTPYKGVGVVHKGASGQFAELAPVLGIVGMAFGLPAIMEAFSTAGVAGGTALAAGEAAGLTAAQVGAMTGAEALGLGAGAGLGTGTMAGTMLGTGGELLGTTAALGAGAAGALNAADDAWLSNFNGSGLQAKSTQDILTAAAKDIGTTILKQQVSKELGNKAGAAFSYGLNASGLGGGSPYKGLSNSLDTGGDITGALTSDQTIGGTNINNIGSNEDIQNLDLNGNPVNATGTNISDLSQIGGITSGYGNSNIGDVNSILGDYGMDANVGTGASGFPINDNLLTGNVGTGASGFPINQDILNGSATSSTPNGDGTTTYDFSDGSTITTDTNGNVIDTGGATGGVDAGGGTSGGGNTSGGTGGGNTGGGNTGGGNTGGNTSGGTDWASILRGLSNYQAAGSAAQAAAAIYAANKQAEAAKRAQDLQQQRFDLINQQFAPQRGAGYSALNQIRGMLPGQYQKYDETGKAIGTGTGNDYFTHQFNPQDLYAGLAPNYNFMLGQGQQAAQRQANLGGGAIGGNALRGLEDYTQNYAQNAYQNAFGNYQTQRTGIYNTLAGIAGIGQQAQNTTANAGQNATNAISQLGVGSAAAQAAGITGAANAVAGGLQNYGLNQQLAQILGQNQNVAQNPNLP